VSRVRRLYVAAAVLSVAAALAGCSSSSSGGSEAGKSTTGKGAGGSAPSPTPPAIGQVPTPTGGQQLPTPTGAVGTSTGTIADYRKAMSTTLDDYQNAWRKYLADCPNGAGSDTCQQDLVVVNLQSGLIALELENAYMVDSPVYVGLPPAQIANIVSRTHADAQKAATDSDPAKPNPAGLATSGAALSADVDALRTALG
jgi:hypothetical protein